MNIIIENKIFTDFTDAIFYCEAKYNFNDVGWDVVKDSEDIHMLEFYLQENGMKVKVVED